MVDVHNVDYSITLAWLPGPKGIRERLPKSHLSVSVWCVYMPLGQSSRQAKERGGLAPPAAASAVLLSPLVDGDGNPRTFHLCSVPRSIAPSWTHRLGCPGLSNPAPPALTPRHTRDTRHQRDTPHTTYTRHTRQVPGPGSKLSTHRSSLASRQRPHGYAAHHMFWSWYYSFPETSTPSALVWSAVCISYCPYCPSKPGYLSSGSLLT